MRSSLKLKERRISNRRKLTGLLPGRLTLHETGKDLSCKPVDISPHGLGLLIDQELEAGTAVVLTIGDRQLRLEVQWSQPDFAKSDRYRYGLVCTDSSVNMEELFLHHKCLK